MWLAAIRAAGSTLNFAAIRYSLSPAWTTYTPPGTGTAGAAGCVGAAVVAAGTGAAAPGMTSFWPTNSRLGLARRLTATIAAALTLNFTMILYSVSPGWMT